jgi:hypothetical protein
VRADYLGLYRRYKLASPSAGACVLLPFKLLAHQLDLVKGMQLMHVYSSGTQLFTDPATNKPVRCRCTLLYGTMHMHSFLQVWLIHAALHTVMCLCQRHLLLILVLALNLLLLSGIRCFSTCKRQSSLFRRSTKHRFFLFRGVYR